MSIEDVDKGFIQEIDAKAVKLSEQQSSLSSESTLGVNDLILKES